MENNDNNDLNAEKKTKAACESEVSQLEEAEAKAKSKSRKEAGKKEDEKTTHTEK